MSILWPHHHPGQATEEIGSIFFQTPPRVWLFSLLSRAARIGSTRFWSLFRVPESVAKISVLLELRSHLHRQVYLIIYFPLKINLWFFSSFFLEWRRAAQWWSFKHWSLPHWWSCYSPAILAQQRLPKVSSSHHNTYYEIFGKYSKKIFYHRVQFWKEPCLLRNILNLTKDLKEYTVKLSLEILARPHPTKNCLDIQ